MNPTEIAAILALRVYKQNVNNSYNLPSIPAGWEELDPPLTVTDGFAYGVFRNTTTNEVVISYRGTDGIGGMMGADGANNFGLALGQATSQCIQAAKVYADVLQLYGIDDEGSNIPAAFSSYTANVSAQFAVRETNVTSYAAPGSITNIGASLAFCL